MLRKKKLDKSAISPDNPPSSNENLMSEFKFTCSHCNQRLQCDEAFAGRQIQCPSCNHLIRVPSIPGQTVKYQGRWYEIQSFWDKSEGGPLGSYRVAGGWSPTTGRSKRGLILLDDRDYPVRNP